MGQNQKPGAPTRLLAGNELIAQPAYGKQHLWVGGVGFEFGAQAAYQVLDLVVVNTFVVLRPDCLPDVVLGANLTGTLVKVGNQRKLFDLEGGYGSGEFAWTSERISWAP